MLAKVNNLMIFILSVCSITANAQNLYFDRLYDFNSLENSAESSTGIINDMDGNGFYFVSRSLNWTTNISTAVLAKIDETGDTILTVKINDINKSFTPTALVRTTDNGVIIASTAKDITTNNTNYSLLKIDANDVFEFVKYYGDTLNNEQAAHVIITNDKGFLIVGQSVVPPNESADMYAVKTDSLGNFEWEQYYGGDNFEGASSVIQTLDSGFLFLGFTQSFGSGGTDWYLVKTDKFGNQQWQKTYGTSVNESGHGIIAMMDSNYLMSGGGGSGNARIRKINPSGDVIWQKSYSYPTGSGGNYLYWAKELPDYSIVATGLTNNTTESDAGWLIKSDSSGTLLWQRKYNKTNTIDLFYDFTIANDNGFILCGSALNTNNNSQDAWLLKVDSVGCEYENCLVGIDEAGSKKVLVDVYPNPASEILNVELQDLGITNYELRITNLEGQVVYESKVQSSKFAIDVSGFASGVYLLTLENSEQRTTLKIVIQHK